jgi:hypothetical protein
MDGPDEFINTTVTVPKDRLAEFYEMFGRWLDASLAHNPADLRRATWDDNDIAAAIKFYEGVSPKAAKILDFWMDAPGEWVSGQVTAEAAGLNGAYGVAGSLSSVGKAAARLARELPFEWKAGEPGASGSYRMISPVADLFRQARGQLNGERTASVQ